MDIQKIRSDINGYGEKLFLNSAGASLMPNQVLTSIQQYLSDEQIYGGYKLAEMRHTQLQEFYNETATLIQASPHNIAFAHDATDAYTKALSSLHFTKNDVIITTDDDYTANHIQFISLAKHVGVQIKRIKNLENGDLNLDHLNQLIQEKKPKLIAVTHIPTNSGLVQDVVSVGKICREHDIIYMVDACQSVGQIPVDVRSIHCDFLTATGRKFLRGPRGTGFLYVSDKALANHMAPLLLDGNGAKWVSEDRFELHPTAKRFQTWESPYALIHGFSTAIRYCNDIGIDPIVSHNTTVVDRLRKNLATIGGVDLYDRGSKTCNIVTFRKQDCSIGKIKRVFDENQVYYSISDLEAGLIDFAKKKIDWAVRLSPHYFNTIEEVDRVSDIIDIM